MLTTLVVLLAAATIAVPLTRRSGFGSVLGYLLAGIVIGPGGTAAHHRRRRDRRDRQPRRHHAAVPDRAGAPAAAPLGDAPGGVRPGPAQVVVTGAALAVLAHAAGLAWPGAAVLGAGLALSSTAIVLPMLAERDLLTSGPGATPSPCCCSRTLPSFRWWRWCRCWRATALPDRVPWLDVARRAAVIAVILVGGRFLMPPLFRAVGGADAGGVHRRRAADRRRHRRPRRPSPDCRCPSAPSWPACCCRNPNIATSCRPTSSRSRACCSASSSSRSACRPICSWRAAHPGAARRATAALLLVKAAIAFVLAGSPARTLGTRCASAALPQASEFSFVLFGAAVAAGALERGRCGVGHPGRRRLDGRDPGAVRRLGGAAARLQRAPEPEYDAIDAAPTPVIICGFGRFGQIVGRVLRMHGIEFTALEKDPARSRWYAGSARRSITAIPPASTCCGPRARRRPG